MRLIAKQGDRFVEIFRVNFYKAKGLSIIGEYSLFSVLEALIPNGINFHSHFIYSDNGNYHFSIKYFDTAENVYVDRKNYYNHIATRKGISSQFDKTIQYERRDKIPNDMLDMFMMTEPLKAWTERPLGHQFGGISISSTPNQLINMKNIEQKEYQTNDLIIDLDKYSNMNINFGVSFFSRNNPSYDLTKLSPEIIVLEQSIERDDLILRTHVIIVSN